MNVRRFLLLLSCAFALGLAAAALVACGGTKDGIPKSDASSLNQQLSDVQEFVERGECGGLNGQLRQVQEGIDNLPSDVDPALVSNLNQGLDRLRTAAVQDCNSTKTETVKTTTTPTTATTVETVPTTTTTTTPTQTQTTTTPTQTQTTAPPTTETTPPPQTDTGGVTPPSDGTGGEGGAGVTP